MSTVKIVSVFPAGHRDAERIARKHDVTFRELAKFGTRHRIVEDAEFADVLVFFVSYALHLGNLDPWRQCVRTHRLFRRYRDKVIVLDLDDRPIPFWRGLFNSSEKRWYDQECHRTVPYIHHGYLWNTRLEPRSAGGDTRFLFSFVGSVDTHLSRKEILRLKYANALIADTSKTNPWADATVKNDWAKRFEESIHASKFILCPRGRGSGSVRVYEAMRAGRVPVIISDAWVPPRGPDWASCSIRVKEADIKRIPQILQENEARFEHLAQSARTVWRNWFSKEMVFDRIVDSGLELSTGRTRSHVLQTAKALTYILPSTYQARRFFASPLKSIASRS